jgi:hypothetical protein
VTAPRVRPEPPESQEWASSQVSDLTKTITERILRNELSRAIGDLGPQKAAQVVIQVFRLKGLPKELRRHL